MPICSSALSTFSEVNMNRLLVFLCALTSTLALPKVILNIKKEKLVLESINLKRLIIKSNS